MDLFDEFSQLVSEFEKEKIDYALCGGLAMAVYAFPRATLDIDILTEPKALQKIKSIAKKLGYTLDSGLVQFKKGAIKIYRVVKVFPDSNATLMLDIMLLTPEIEDVWNLRQTVPWEKGALQILSPKGLIKLKTMRLNGQDQDDIKNLESLFDEG